MSANQYVSGDKPYGENKVAEEQDDLPKSEPY